MSPVSRGNLTSSLPTWLPFTCLVAVAGTFRTMFNKSDSGHSCLVPDLRGKAFSFFAIQCDGSCEFVICGVCIVDVCSHYTHFVESLA